VSVRTSSGACGALGSVQGGSVALPSSRIQARVPAGETSGSHCGERRSGWQSGNWLSDRRTGTTPRRADIFALSAMTSGHHSRVHTETIRPCSVRVHTAIPRSVTDDRIKLEPPAHTWSQSARTPSTAVVPFVRFLPGARHLPAQTPSPTTRGGRCWTRFGPTASLSPFLAEQLIGEVGSRASHGRDHRRVCVHRERCAAVAKSLAHGLYVHAGREQLRRVRVAKVVEPRARQPELGDDAAEVRRDPMPLTQPPVGQPPNSTCSVPAVRAPVAARRPSTAEPASLQGPEFSTRAEPHPPA
jgi:hypothetical protein